MGLDVRELQALLGIGARLVRRSGSLDGQVQLVAGLLVEGLALAQIGAGEIDPRVEA